MLRRLVPLLILIGGGFAAWHFTRGTRLANPSAPMPPAPSSQPDADARMADADAPGLPAQVPSGSPFWPARYGADFEPWRPGNPGFPDVAAARGLDYVNRSGTPEKQFVLEANGAGVALLDLAQDGDLDVVFAQGVESIAALLEGPGADLCVYANAGPAEFERQPGPGLAGWWTGLATGDIDADGATDLVAGAYGDLELLLQRPDGTLAAGSGSGLVPERPGARIVPGAEREPGPAPLWVSSLSLLDADRDGFLDLYVGQYLDLDPLAPPQGSLGEGALALPCTWKGASVFCGPRGLTPQADRLLRGSGDGRFEDLTERWLGSSSPGFTLAVAAFDADADGDQDLYVANDSVPNQLWINELEPGSGAAGPSGTFTDLAQSAGVAVNADGAPEAGMGIATGDVNGDGVLDLAVTNFSDEPTQLYLGAAMGFETATYRRGLNQASRRLLSWGVHLTDFDADGWPELFTGNGHVYPQADAPHTGTRYAQPDTLWTLGWAALGGDTEPRRVRRVAPRWKDSILFATRGTRGSATGDLDGDGAPDLVLNYIDGPAGLGLNRLAPTDHQYLALLCLGPEQVAAGAAPRTPRDGRGARVQLTTPATSGPNAEARTLLAESGTGGSYQSASSPWIHFGLGTSGTYTEIRIRWPSGAVDVLPAGPAGRRLWVREGAGLLRSEPLKLP